MFIKGSIYNEFGEKVGSYWYREGMNRYSYSLYHNTSVNGYTEEGLYNHIVNHLQLQMIEE